MNSVVNKTYPENKINNDDLTFNLPWDRKKQSQPATLSSFICLQFKISALQRRTQGQVHSCAG